MDVTCPKCNTVLEYNPRDGIAKRKTCTNPNCHHKFNPNRKSPSPSRVQNVQNSPRNCNADHTYDGIALQGLKNVQKGSEEIADVQSVQGPASLSNAAPGTSVPSSSPSSPSCNVSSVQVAMPQQKKLKKLGSLGSPPMPIGPEDIKVLAGIQKGENQVQIAAKLKWDPSRVCRRIQKLQAHQLVIVDSKTGKRVANPVYFPKLAGKTPPPVQTTTGTLPGKKYSIHVHNVQCYCAVMPSSLPVYQKLRKTLPLLNHMEYWDRLYIDDKDLGYFGAKHFANPGFMVLSTPKGLYFHPWGWGNTDDEADLDAQKGAEELHDKLEQLYGIKLGFEFNVVSPSGKRQPHYALHANTTAPVQVSPSSSPGPQPVQVQSSPSVYPQVVVKGHAIGPDVSHPDDWEVVSKPGGKALTEVAKDLELLPIVIDETEKLKKTFENAVSQFTTMMQAMQTTMQAMQATMAQFTTMMQSMQPGTQGVPAKATESKPPNTYM